MDINLKEIGFDLLLNIINIIVLFIIVKLLVYKPVKSFLDARNAKIKEEIEKAEELTSKANQTLAERDSILEDGRKKGEELANKAYEDAKANADSIIRDAKEEAKSILEKAQSDIADEKEKMLKSSKDEIAELSVSIAEKILEREVNAKDNEKIVNDFFAEV